MDTQQAIAEAAVTKKLVIRSKRLKTLPSELFDLTELESLTLARCGIRDLPAEMVKLRNLRFLNLDANPLDRLPAVIPQMTGLERLGLLDTGIREVPEEFQALANLTHLSLSGNLIVHFPELLRRMSRLEYLDLGFNDILSLPVDLTGLSGLRTLILRVNPLQGFPDPIRDLVGLRVLDLSGKGISADLRSRIFPVPGNRPPGMLNTDATSRTLVGSLPDWIDELAELEWLILDDNQLGTIPAAIGRLARLKGLSLPCNRLRTVPDRLPGSLEYLDLQENPLPLPPEILSTLDAKAIAEFISRLSDDTRPLNEAKLLIVGEAAVGKTSLVNRLVHNEFDPHEPKTDGICTTPWPVGEITLNMWDFGGQEIMHATHQFFLTRRSVYLLVINARQDEDQNRLEYWLKIIQSFSGGSQIILVGNKTDEGPLDIDQRGLRAKYPDIHDVVSISCSTGDGIDDLRAAICSAVDRLSHVRDPLPAGFFAVKQQLERMDRNFVSFEDYHRLCRENGVHREVSQELLIGFLHDLGTVLCFRDDPRLANTNILNPAWVTGGVYKILNSHLAAQRKGLLTIADVHEILESIEYPPERRLFIIDMMKRFELCFESEGTFLVPDLLIKEEPDTGPWEETPAFVIKYDVLPPSVMCRLIVRMHQAISMRTVWRTGVVFATEKNRALVKADREDATITIRISGPHQGRRGLLTAIRMEIRAIAQTIPGLDYEELVPVPGRPGVMVPHTHLVEMEAAGRTTVVPQGMVTDVSIRELLDGVETLTELEPATSAARPENEEPSSVWTPRQALALAAVLFGTALVLFVVAALLGQYLGNSLVPIFAAAIVSAGIIGVFVLRAAGRLSERGFVETLKELLPKKGE